MGLLEAGQWFALAWLVISIPVSLVAGRLLARNNARYPLVRAPRPGERVATVHQLHPPRRATVGRAVAVGVACSAVVFSAVGTAAALGGLPATAQSATATVIEALSPFRVPHESPSPASVARSRAEAAVRAATTGRPPVRSLSPTPGPTRTPDGLPVPAPGIAAPTVAPDEAPPTNPAPTTPAPAVVPTPTATSDEAPPEQPTDDPSPTDLPSDPATPTEQPSPTTTTDPPTVDPSPSQTPAAVSPSPTPSGDPAGPTATPEPTATATDTPTPNPTP